MIHISTLKENSKAQQAVFFATGFANSIIQQYIEVDKYCDENNLPLVNMFIETSKDEEKLYKKLNEMLEFISKQQTKTAVVIASQFNILCSVELFDIMHLIIDDNTELHFASRKLIFSGE